MDSARLGESFAHVAMHGDEVALFFYSDLFLRHPEIRDMFPVSMAAQRDRLLHALGRIVAETASLDGLAVFLQELGRDHRKFGTLAEHYEPVGTSLLATLAHFSGARWTPELAAEWKAAYSVFRVATLSRLSYLPGQSVAIESGERPGIWRFYSMANAPRSGAWSGHDAYIAGPTQMVEATATVLTCLGVPRQRIHVEDFGWSEQ